MREDKRGNILVNVEEKDAACLGASLLETPVSSPNPKKVCADIQDGDVSNSDILKAIQDLASRFTSLERNINQNTADIKVIQENMEGLDFMTKTTSDKVQGINLRLSEQDKKIEEAERYSRRWNLRLRNLPEKANETIEDLRSKVYELLGEMAPEDKDRLDLLIDTLHRVGEQRRNSAPRPVLIQFSLRTFRQKIWRAALKARVLKEKDLRITEDLTYWERQCRNKLWPLVAKAKENGKKTSWRGPDAIIEGKRITAAAGVNVEMLEQAK